VKWGKDEKGKPVRGASAGGADGVGAEGGELEEEDVEDEEAGVGPHLDPSQYFPTLLPLRQHAPDVQLAEPEKDQLPTTGIPEDLALSKVRERASAGAGACDDLRFVCVN
jgi:hypothetical protein